jgi:hypothetical protein
VETASGMMLPDAYVRADLPLGSVAYTPGDFGGDGKTDLLITTNSGSYLYNGSSNAPFVPNVYVRNDLPLGAVAYY